MVAVVPASFRGGCCCSHWPRCAVRLAWVGLEPATSPVADENMWLTWGAAILPSPEVAFSPLKLRFIFHPPLYLYLVGAASECLGSFSQLRYAQALLGATLARRVGLLGRRLSGEAAACSPPPSPPSTRSSSGSSRTTGPRRVFTVLLWWGFERLAAADERRLLRARRVAAGVCFGLAILTRETVLYFVPLAGLWLAWRRGAALRRAAAVRRCRPRSWSCRGPCATGCLRRLRARLDGRRPQPVAGQHPRGAPAGVRGVLRRPRQDREVRARAAQGDRGRSLERQPWWIFEKLRDELPEYWAAHGQPIVHIERGAYGDVPRPLGAGGDRRGARAVPAAAGLFVPGIAFLPRGRLAVLLVGFLVFYVLLHVATHGYPRYRLPSLPVLFLVGAHGLVGVARARRRSAAATRSPAAAAALALALAVAPSLVTWATPAVAAALVRERRGGGRGRRAGRGRGGR